VATWKTIFSQDWRGIPSEKLLLFAQDQQLASIEAHRQADKHHECAAAARTQWALRILHTKQIRPGDVVRIHFRDGVVRATYEGLSGSDAGAQPFITYRRFTKRGKPFKDHSLTQYTMAEHMEKDAPR